MPVTVPNVKPIGILSILVDPTVKFVTVFVSPRALYPPSAMAVSIASNATAMGHVPTKEVVCVRTDTLATCVKSTVPRRMEKYVEVMVLASPTKFNS